MPDQTILDPVSAEDPCGPDLRWDPEFASLEHAFEMATSTSEDVVEGEAEADDDGGLQEVISTARQLCAKTKDMRVLAMLAEAQWRSGGLAAFGDVLADLVAVAETWPEPDTGFHPRADEEDGDLSERNAPLARLVGRVPMLAEVSGWGTAPAPETQQSTRDILAGVFGRWTDRLEPAFGRDVASPRDAWAALRGLVGEPGAQEGDATGDATEGQPPVGASVAPPPTANAWDALDHALQLMALQNSHSPAIPVLRLLATWREADIIDIAEAMREAGVTLEQLLEAIKKRLDG